MALGLKGENIADVEERDMFDGLSPDHDVVTVDDERDGDDHWERVNRQADVTGTARSPQQGAALGTRECASGKQIITHRGHRSDRSAARSLVVWKLRSTDMTLLSTPLSRPVHVLARAERPSRTLGATPSRDTAQVSLQQRPLTSDDTADDTG
jgi:hypothetical protein